MPTRENTPAGAPCWADLMTSDAEGAKAFYRELFGWGAEKPAAEFGGYTNLTKDGVRIGGLMPKQPGMEAPDGWSIYLATPDAEKTVAAATEHGGGVIVPPMAVGDLGVMAVITDSTGAAIGIWQPGVHTGFGVVAEPGAPGWFELYTRDFPAALDFYREVFGWDVHIVGDTPEFRYATNGEGESACAGIMDGSAFLPDGVPPHWAVYFGTADTDASLERVATLGGRVIEPGIDTPYGRLGVAADPTGATFKLVGPNVSATPPAAG
ncbi:Lactoylglutathione lyase family protein [Frankia canadensis]|uniref:Lactoylglutathione lyase family protein n=1 Tax=Frankia canadensis TaxID=1836972 RepID=A0A2I2L1U1_9ACTN|nr:VOC family protein [Frankia canadensis]SNQ51893.1 Lactoylglutathione lyase family protein [Frankia canadensis]SOU59183.1 Lactoylglutathione lyase family protein [Frankia canadensis]